MSDKEDNDAARLYNCFRKYEEIVKQVLLLDELTESMDPSSRVSKRKTSSRGINGDAANNGSVQEKESFDKAIVETITKFLHDLDRIAVDPNPKSSDQ